MLQVRVNQTWSQLQGSRSSRRQYSKDPQPQVVRVGEQRRAFLQMVQDAFKHLLNTYCVPNIVVDSGKSSIK